MDEGTTTLSAELRARYRRFFAPAKPRPQAPPAPSIPTTEAPRIDRLLGLMAQHPRSLLADVNDPAERDQLFTRATRYCDSDELPAVDPGKRDPLREAIVFVRMVRREIGTRRRQADSMRAGANELAALLGDPIDR